MNSYTGLPSLKTLMVLFGFVSDFILGSSETTLSKFQKLVLVQMKLGHNFPVQDIDYGQGVLHKLLFQGLLQ